MSDILALKYRPHKLNDLVGQEQVTQSITNAFNRNRLHHAYLFSGVKGTGKTSICRILAASLNCENGPTLEPCCKCKMCQEIFIGRALDIKEINAASNRGIDDMRSLFEYARKRPLEARKKMILIDEAHSLSREAAECMLKLLEEPPEHVIFCLATTDVQKMKPTILSRCLPFRFRKIPWPIILEHLKFVSKQENIQSEEGALRIASKLAKGSMRDALQNMQMVIDFAGNDAITTDNAQKALGAIADDRYLSIIGSLLGEEMDTVTALKGVQGLFAEGYTTEQVLDGMLEVCHTLMICRSCKNTAGLVYLSDEEQKAYGQMSGKVSINTTVNFIEDLNAVYRQVVFNNNPQYQLEAWVVKAALAIAREKAQITK